MGGEITSLGKSRIVRSWNIAKSVPGQMGEVKTRVSARWVSEIESKRESGRDFNEKTERPPKNTPHTSDIMFLGISIFALAFNLDLALPLAAGFASGFFFGAIASQHREPRRRHG